MADVALAANAIAKAIRGIVHLQQQQRHKSSAWFHLRERLQGTLEHSESNLNLPSRLLKSETLNKL